MTNIERRIRQAYLLERRLFEAKRTGEAVGTIEARENAYWDGGRDVRGVMHKPVWPRILSFARDNNTDPEDLIRAVFANWSIDTPPPTPAQCTGDAALYAYQVYRTAMGSTIDIKFQHYKNKAREEFWKLESLGLTYGERWRLVVLSPTLGAGPLFRYGLACNSGNCADLAEKYRQPAMIEYIRYIDEYDEAMGKYLPSTFCEDARKLREKILSA